MSIELRLGIIGCGLIGRKRALAAGACPVIHVADTNSERAHELARLAGGAQASNDWRHVTDDPRVDAVIIATPHMNLAPIAGAAVAAGKHVLLEKPGARSAGELAPVLAAQAATGVCVKVGYNHRFHPALRDAKKIVESGEVGPLMFLRGRYGHGGRVGYEKEWRADPEISGGGELLDQGSHLIDLARWFLGDFTEVNGFLRTCFWAMPVEDNAFLSLGTAAGQIAWLHATWTEWKNMFSFEIYGRDAKLDICGLGGSYGPERLIWYRMRPEMGPPDTTVRDYEGPDRSWEREFEDFLNAVDTGQEPCGSLRDARAVLSIIDQLYQTS